MKSLMLVTLLTLVSCASTVPGKQYRQSDEYIKRPKITESFYKDQKKAFSTEQIKTLLSQKLELPKSLKIAFVKIGHSSTITTLANFDIKRQQSVVVKNAMVEAFDKINGKDKRIKEIAFVPQMIMPENPNLENLRDVAAMMQADLVLILETRSETDTKFHLHKKNEAKAVATVEAIAVDIKTGVIPFTTIATNSTHIREDKEFSHDELYQKATIEAENKALAEIAANLGDYFN
jgi:Tfp pilus assembly major pilin PilA